MRITDQPSTGLTLCTDLAATDWLVDQDLPWYQLAGRGPIGFPKYARLRFIPDPSFPGQKSNDVDFDQTGPEEKVLIASPWMCCPVTQPHPTSAISACGPGGGRSR